MAKLSEMSVKVQVALIVVVAIAITVAAYFLVYKSLDDTNRSNRALLQAKIRDNDLLRPYEKNMAQLNAEIELLNQQLLRYKMIVPDEKQADAFMHMMQSTATAAGIEIRRYTAKPVAAKEFYTEVPFDIELDGPYYSMVNFFDRVSKLERIINVSNVQMGSLQESAFKKSYQYAPNESVGAKCVATTFFSRDLKESAPAAKPAANKGAKK